MISNLFKHFRRKFGGGILIILPLFITVWILSFLFSLIDSWITPSLIKLLTVLNVPFINTIQARVLIPVIGIILLVFFLYLLGLLGSNYFGKATVKLFEERILRIPFIKSIYGSSKQILDAFSSSGEKGFRNVVITEYPRKGMYALGFLTSEKGHYLKGVAEEEMITVFLPTTPNPTSGYFVFVPKKEVIFLDMSVEDGLKMIVSGGIIRPDKFERKNLEDRD